MDYDLTYEHSMMCVLKTIKISLSWWSYSAISAVDIVTSCTNKTVDDDENWASETVDVGLLKNEEVFLEVAEDISYQTVCKVKLYTDIDKNVSASLSSWCEISKTEYAHVSNDPPMTEAEGLIEKCSASTTIVKMGKYLILIKFINHERLTSKIQP